MRWVNRVRDAFVDLFGRGEAHDTDPAAFVELETAKLSDGPMIVAALRREGVVATCTEVFDPVTALTRARIMVRRSDVPDALRVMARLR